MTDTNVRRLHRLWLLGETSSEEYAKARERAGLDPRILPSVSSSEAVLSAWPKTKKGNLKQAENLTYDQARNVSRAYFASLGWKMKIYARLGDADVPGYYRKNEFTWLPLGFPEERDPNWNPIPYGAYISPTFDEFVTHQPRTVFFYRGWMAEDSLTGKAYWSWNLSRMLDLEIGPWNVKTIAYHLLLRARNGLVDG